MRRGVLFAFVVLFLIRLFGRDNFRLAVGVMFTLDCFMAGLS